MAKSARTKTKVATADSASLRKKKADMQAEFGKSKNTKNVYKGYYDRGVRILQDVVKERKAREKKNPGCLTDGIDNNLLAKAFTGPPNKHSVYAVEMYLTQKCVVEDLGKSTADGIHGAMADYWDKLPGGQYNGPYSYDEDTGKVHGNPARAPEVLDFLKCVKNKARVKGAAATRHHAEATTIEDMRLLMQWSESECSHKKLESLKFANSQDLLLQIKHGLMRAFLSSGFVLWTRNFETCQIQERDLSNGTGPAPYYLPYLGVFLDNRKGWQKKQGYDGPLESNHYQIYEQEDTPEIDMFTHLRRWRILYRHLLGRDFEPDDYLFPFVSSNGTIHAKKPMTHETAQDLLNEFTLGAKIDKTFTTHCLRRGGAQYRFMFAPIGKRWSLSIIRWWGGWAVGEQVDTLMRYLLDSLQSYETGHGDALYPFRTEPDKSFMGEHKALQPPSTAEFRLFGAQILTKLDSIVAQVQVAGQPLPASQLLDLVGSMQRASVSSDMARITVATSSCVNHIPAQFHGQHTHSHHASPEVSRPQPTVTQPSSFTSSVSDENSDPNSVVPVSGAIIPGVGRDSQSWKRAIDQWFKGDPDHGLQVALKDWPASWYSGKMRLVTGTLYSNRKLLAEEYERLGCNDEEFMQNYPEYPKITLLLNAIRQSKGLVRKGNSA